MTLDRSKNNVKGGGVVEGPDMRVPETEGVCAGSERVACCLLDELESASDAQIVDGKDYRLE